MQPSCRFGVLVALQLAACAVGACGGASATGEASVSAGVGSEGTPAASAAGGSGTGARSPGGRGDRAQGAEGAPGPDNGPVPEDEGMLPAAGGLPVVSLPGFRVLPDGRSLVSLEVSGRVPVTQSTAAGRVSYHLPGVRVPERTNRFDLPTDFFATPVGRVRLLAVDGGADLVIELRAPAKPTARVRQSDRGVVLQVELPRLDAARVPEAAVLDNPGQDAEPGGKAR
jgi:hypothetical protein